METYGYNNRARSNVIKIYFYTGCLIFVWMWIQMAWLRFSQAVVGFYTVTYRHPICWLPPLSMWFKKWHPSVMEWVVLKLFQKQITIMHLVSLIMCENNQIIFLWNQNLCWAAFWPQQTAVLASMRMVRFITCSPGDEWVPDTPPLHKCESWVFQCISEDHMSVHVPENAAQCCLVTSGGGVCMR